MKKILYISAIIVGTTTGLFAQEGFGTSNPDPSSVIDMVANDKGVLLPRVALTNLNDNATITSPADYLTVMNTASAGTGNAAVSPGYYYWLNNQWNAVSSSSQQPWNIQTTTNQATNNTQDIYQMGSVTIGKDEAIAPLDVVGAIRGGNPNLTATVGANSIAIGNSVEASGSSSSAFGNQSKATAGSATALGALNTASGFSAVAMGYENVASGQSAFAMGQDNLASGQLSFVLGSKSKATYYSSIAIGELNESTKRWSVAIGLRNKSFGELSYANGLFLEAKTKNEAVFGRANKIITGNHTDSDLEWYDNDALFQIGDGIVTSTNSRVSKRSNALTILKNGKSSFGMDSSGDVIPTERLDIIEGNLRVRDINTVIGDVADRIVVADVDGVLRTVDASAVNPTSDIWINKPVENRIELEHTSDGSTNRMAGTEFIAFDDGNVTLGTDVPATLYDISNSPVAKLTIEGGDVSVNGITLGRGGGNANDHNTALGYKVLEKNDAGQANTGIGYLSLSNNINGWNNTAIGYNSLTNNNASYNVGIGNRTLQENTTGNNNTAVGFQTLYKNTTGQRNTAYGVQALQKNITGIQNDALGVQALVHNEEGSYNVGLGYYALRATKGNSNIGIGNKAGERLTSGDNNIFIGAGVRPNISNTSSNQLNIGDWIYGDDGKIGINVKTPKVQLEVGGTDAMKVPVGTTAQRPATPEFGQIRYNSTIGRGEMYVNDVNGDGVQGDAGWRPM